MIPVRVVEIIDSWLQLRPGQQVFSSLEGESPGGSIKDRMVFGELKELADQNKLNSKTCISEVSAGSTALSLAHYCGQFGLKCSLYVPTTISSQIADSLRQTGADLRLVEMSMIYEIYNQEMSGSPDTIKLNQLFDGTKKRHYQEFGQKLLQECGPLSAVIGSVGTGHSLLGTASGMDSLRVISAEPFFDPNFRVPGIRNVEHERYGEADTCQHSFFDERKIVYSNEIFPKMEVETSEGPVQIPQSFQVVLGALKKYLATQASARVFALGAALKRSKTSDLRKSA